MNNTNTGGPAFPTTKPLEHWGDPNQGMTLRDYFAAKAMQAQINNPLAVGGDEARRVIAERAYRIADAMIKAREV